MTTSTPAIPLLPNYRPTEVIDEDSYTIMYRATREHNGQSVIVKTLKADRPQPRHVARLMHEYQVTKDLDLPGVVRAYGLERYHDNVAIILEDFGGRSLKEELAHGPLDLSTFLRTAIVLAEALSGIHRHHIIHKDIKPQNIIVNSETGAVKITDFGIASQLASESQRLGVPQLLEGTLSYMSPEQTGRMNRTIDYRSDFYSLGVTLYEMLSGTLPFTGTDPMELVHSHIARRPVPPHDLVPGIPQPISDMVMKLLAKTAEERYQHAHGLKADLERCLEQWEATGQIEPFELGRQDLADSFRIPQKLYGREAEIEQLLQAFAQASEGQTGLVLVSGYSGIGKTALVHEIHKPVTAERGFFISGKFDQLKRTTPHAAIIQAFQELIAQLLQNAEQLEHWRELLQLTLGANGQLMLDVIPELEQIIGPQPAVPQLGPTESQNRFHMTMRHFIGVFAQQEHPLVIFLDDLQWADQASLRLIQLLLADEELGHLLIIGAYRDNEVHEAHPLMLMFDEIEQAGTQPQRIVLAPLGLEHINRLITDTLSTDPASTQELAVLVEQKTGGNPFFLQQFLKMLYEEKLVVFDISTHGWTWSLAQIRETAVTDNVVSLMASKIQRLAPTTQRVLMLAACLGHQFDLKLLSLLHNKSLAATAGDLWEAIAEGLVLPLDADYKLLQSEDSGTLEALNAADFSIRYRFLHDRVQQAADELIPEQEQQSIHLAIGRHMLNSVYADNQDEHIFVIVNHLNAGAALITSQQERDLLALLNLNAGKRAKASTAYEAANLYIRTGVALLAADSWQSHYGLTLALYQEYAECEHLTGQLESAEALFQRILEQAQSSLDKVRIYTTRVSLYANMGRYAEGVALGLEGLRILGINFPESDEERQAAIGAALQAVAVNRGGREIGELLHAPTMHDLEKKAAMNLLMALVPLAYNTSPALLGLITLEMVNTSLQYGNTDISAYSYAAYGYLTVAILGDFGSGYAFGRLAIDLIESFNNLDLRGKIHLIFGEFIEHWRTHLSAGIGSLKQAYLDSLEVGDLIYAGFACWIACGYRFIAGEELHSVAREARRYLNFAEQTKNEMIGLGLTLLQQAILSLQGRTAGLSSFSSETLAEDELLQRLRDPNYIALLNQYYIFKLQSCYLAGDYQAALALLPEAEATSAGLSGTAFIPELVFYAALSVAAVIPTLPEAEREPYQARLNQYYQQIRAWAEHAPANHSWRVHLLDAELARLAGKDGELMDLYDRAIELARQEGFIHSEGLVNEAAARFYLAHGKEKIARVYLLDAHYAYSKWGASAKVQQLLEHYPNLLSRALTERPARETSTATGSRTGTTSTTAHERADLLDMITVLKAAQAISGEIVLDSLLQRLMEIVLQNAGAQKGHLILNRDGQLIITAAMSSEPEMRLTRPALAVELSTECAQSVLRHVASSLEPLVLNDAAHDQRFGSDHYIQAYQPKSLLCLPLVNQGHLTGLLYLENNLATDVFTPARIELLGLLSSQAAIAIENALLYQNLQQMSDQLRETNRALEEQNQTLERRVEERTIELREANARLQLELLERQRMEEERVRLQEEIIRAQAQTLAELSTPLIPITDSVLVMPLIGAMDSARAQQVLETLLHGVQTNRGRLVIIDITGVPVVDTAVASTLMRAAQALRLLGAQTVITGIRPEVAQTIVQLGLDLTSITTTGSLQNGIAYALRQAGQDALGADNGGLWGERLGRNGELR